MNPITRSGLILTFILPFMAWSQGLDPFVPRMPNVDVPMPPTPDQYFPKFGGSVTRPKPAILQPPVPATAEEVYRQAMAEMYADLARMERKASYAMPSCMGEPGAEVYRDAYREIAGMLKGEQPLDLGRAVFLTENAYRKDTLSYEKFDEYITGIAMHLSEKLEKEKYQRDNSAAKMMILHRFFTDTMWVWNEQTRRQDIHYPFVYDFDDPEGRKDWSKQFVTKLLITGSGQCHSLPLLYLILAQKMGLEAYLVFSPSHSYIRIRNSGKWYNLELTNGRLTTDSWILGSNYVKAEAIQHGLYMDTLGVKSSVASCLADLAMGYERAYCIDDFVLQTLNTALHYHPMLPMALAVKSDYYTFWFAHALKISGCRSPQELYRFPEALALYEERNDIYRLLDEIGYENMPEEVYQRWLRSVNEEKRKREHHHNILELENQIRNR